MTEPTFVAFWTKSGIVQAGMTVNTPNRISDIETLIASSRPTAADELIGFRARTEIVGSR